MMCRATIVSAANLTKAERSRRVLDAAILLNRHCPASHYNFAKVIVMAAPIDPDSIVDAANQLYLTFVGQPLYRLNYEQDSTFNQVRQQINVHLKRKPDPTERYQRRLAANSVGKK